MAIDDGMGLNAASRAFGISKPTIRRHRLGLNKYASDDVKCMGGPLFLPASVEDELVKHVKDLDAMMFGITAKDLMSLAYEVAVAHGITKFSDVKKSAGKKWYYSCMRRHTELSLRSPEPNSLARAAWFNREAVYHYYDLLEKLIDEHHFTPDKIYNVDETGHSTVQTPSKVLSTKGKRQVGATTSAERGSTTTGVYCHSGTGNYLAPMLVFRRKRIANSLKADAPAGKIFACTDSGWIDSDCFLIWLKHFIASVNPSVENKHLLLLDGHASHTKNLEAIKLARENGVLMLSFPPHTTHKMQPLDVSFFRSLKNWYNIEIEKFLRTHPGQAVTVHQISKFVSASFVAAATMGTAVNGFRKAGVWPPNRHVFDDEFDRIELLQPSTAVHAQGSGGGPSHPAQGSVGDRPSSPGQGSGNRPSSPVLGSGGDHPSTPVQGSGNRPSSPVLGSGGDHPSSQEQGSDGGPSSSSVQGSGNRPSSPMLESGGGPASPMLESGGGPSSSVQGSGGGPSNPVQGSDGQWSRPIPTKGDGRCFFRSVAIGLHKALQSAKRDQTTGEVVDKMTSLSEMAHADNLRARVFAHMCQAANNEPDEAALNADMPLNINFKTLTDRILHMSNPLAMIGEREIKCTAEVIGRTLHVMIEESSSPIVYREGVGDDNQPPIVVKYMPHGDAGHYEAIISLRLNDISPLPQKVRKSKSTRTSKAEILTSSPYKKKLEMKSNQHKIKSASEKSKKSYNTIQYKQYKHVYFSITRYIVSLPY